MAEAVMLIEKIQKAIEEDLGMKAEEIRKRAKEARNKLSEFMINFYYKTDEGKYIRELLSIAAHESGYADELREWWTPEKRNELRKIARDYAKLDVLYRWAWGKHVKRKE